MQVTKEELQYQQMVLKHLGFYRGPLDGIWSADSIAAKREFEFKKEFAPAIPTNGLPFGVTDRLPKGIHFKRVGPRILLSHINITEEMEREFITPTNQSVASREPEAVVGESVSLEPITQVIEEPKITAADELSVTNAESEIKQQPNQQQHKQHNHQHGQKPGHRR